MNRVFLILIIAFFPLVAKAAPVPAVVEKFYTTMQAMSEAVNDNRAREYQTDLMNCFKGVENSGINVPNDFMHWGLGNDHHIPANNYSRRFYELAYQQKKLRMTSHKIKSSQYINEIELEKFKNKKANEYIQTVVLKTLSDGKSSKTYSDTLIIENDKIVIFTNAMYNGGENVNIDALRALAARFYSIKQYRKAYETYEKIIQHDPKNSNAYYRLSILTYYGAGCKADTKKAIDYAEKARNLYYPDAERAIYYYKTKQRI